MTDHMESPRTVDVNHLPHKKPMLLIDRIVDTTDSKSIAEMSCPADAFYFQGHFPGKPLMPGVIMIEACAQTAAFAMPNASPGDVVFLTSVEKAKFYRPVVPGDVLTLEANWTRMRRDFHCFTVRALVGDQICMKGELSLFHTKKSVS